MNGNRQSPFANLTPVVKNLLVLNLICFIPYVVLSNDSYDFYVVKNLGVFYFNSPFFRPWQIISYMFIHGGWEHILFNMFALFSFGPILEYAVGPKKFFNLYFICGIGAVAFQMLVQAVELHSIIGSFTIPNDLHISDPLIVEKIKGIYAPVVGASGAIFGVLVAFGMLYPDLELMILFIPVPVKAKYIIPVYIVVEVVLGFGQFGNDNVAHFAHLGGALLGFIMVKIWRLQPPGNY
jgi:membrane associated rhomboid family serine protease